MSPALIQLFAFMTCTFVLGLFLGWSLWRYGGVSKSAIDDLEAKTDFLKKSLEQSRMQLWNLQERTGAQDDVLESSRPTSRRRTSQAPTSRNPLPTNPSQPAQT